MQFTLRQQCVCLRLTAGFAFLWIVARAAVQAITIDEADTFLAYVAPAAPTHWSGSANNQLLNSLLMRLFTSIFGAWHLSVRAPALIGAAIYIVACYLVVRSIARRTAIQWPLFVCLVFNPFVMDYLVAARGYGLALGFWMAAIALRRNAIAASLCAGLSFASNFSFAFADISVMLLVLLCQVRQAGNHYLATYLKCIAPGLAVALLLAGSVLWNWPHGQFVHGATSVRETVKSIVECSLYEVNPYLINPPLKRFLEAWGVWSFPLFGIACLIHAARAGWKRVRICAALCGVAALTAAAHWILFRYFGVLLPKERTAIYFAPLAFLIAGAAIAVPTASKVRSAAIVLFFVPALYFLSCLRLNYFREWKFDADVKQVYSVLAYYNHTFGLRDVLPNWRYSAALNYYRVRSGSETLPKLEYKSPPYPGDHAAYVMYFPADEQFIQEHHLKIVYFGRLSDVVVAIRPELEKPAAAGSCSVERPGPI